MYDLVLISVRIDQLASACNTLPTPSGRPTLLFFGNNPAGRSVIPRLPGSVRLGFPGIGGRLKEGTVDYVRIRQQPTVLESGADPILGELETTLGRRGFGVTRVVEIDGWLLYHRRSSPALPRRCTCAERIRPASPLTARC